MNVALSSRHNRNTKSRFTYRSIFLALMMLLSPGFSCGLGDSVDQAVAILDKAIEAKEPSKVPWSGWWWPTGYFPPPLAAEGGPLDKFDQYIAGLGLPNPGARSWEAIHHYKPGCFWCGHCHGWAAAAILEPEPTRPGKVGMIDFTVGDLKGLLTEAHSTDAYDLIEGKRDIVTLTKDDELKALVFHQVLLDWVSNGEPVIMDRTKKPEVQNHPVYKCQMTTRARPERSTEDPRNSDAVVRQRWRERRLCRHNGPPGDLPILDQGEFSEPFRWRLGRKLAERSSRFYLASCLC